MRKVRKVYPGVNAPGVKNHSTKIFPHAKTVRRECTCHGLGKWRESHIVMSWSVVIAPIQHNPLYSTSQDVSAM